MKLIVNIWADGKGWGPGFGNADQVPAEVAAQIDDPAVWDTSEPAPTSVGDGGAEGSVGATAGDPTPAPDHGAAEPVHGNLEAIPAYEEAVLADLTATVDLAAMDKPALLAHAASLGITVDGRLGAKRIRQTIEAAAP